ncbi:protein translocase subunit SecDF [Staphylococcus pseudintermedius]|uniref:protein translocase subunit SecDF n=3 Tax=Staphylococcus pseudintermedius TaxID=283734 RepID=UPI000809663B|nr:protein translocase subunit SecDF [Staphylococcus pseudintermedius]ANS89364.1 Protein-export membrane protein SecD / Protein-export membrane protein SecF [Staphylococcus pseudintermedius]EGQ0368311.1 protein translocase subunit SecDF [Staphylococcus pseudintermedius]EGQ1292177.1 protein translocase subunit SecDF [Staphylococcus pseudintermedius]EGQ1653271.1 protein translocase subunit SecDF [Staphylococcus pseudintermedius]EGQ1698223.1 protein translocase subunit SecDF [Staphylococcus pseud
MKKVSRLITFILLVVLLFAGMSATYKSVIKNVNLGLDLQGGFEVLYQVNPLGDGEKIDNTAVQSTAKTLERRVNVLGVSEPKIQVEDQNRIRVQLAGVQDQNQARKILSSQANLTIRDADDKVLLTGKDLVQGSAKQEFKQNTNQPAVTFKLKDSDKFKKVTEEISKKQENVMVVWLDFEKGDSYEKEKTKEDPKFISAASVNQPINSTNVEISGGFQGEKGISEAKQIADLLNSGSLPVELKEIYSTSVGAQFGQDALDKTINASMIGIGIIFLFMLLFYRLPGIVAVITLTTYIYLTMVAFNFISGVLTLPGLAALVLGVGMAVDANIIMYERIKDEIRIGRTLKQAYKKANKSSFITILDANLTTVLAAAVLFFFGESSVKGFATMLLLAILMSFVTAVFLTRVLLSLVVHSNVFKKKLWWFGVKQSQIHDINKGYDVHELSTPYDKVDFMKWAKPLFALSGVVIVAGVIILAIFKLNLGIDFTSGTRVDLQSNQKLTQAQVEKTMESIDLKPNQLSIGGSNNENASMQFKRDLNKDEVAKVTDTLKSQYGKEPSVNTVSPVIGQELAKNAMLAVIIASIGMIIYISLRFEWRMGIASIISLLHDAFMIIAVFSLFRLEVDITFIAAVLTIIGYSINDTIVTFDRVREMLSKIKVITKEEQIDYIVNSSIRQTLTRSINTVLTVVIVVIALLVLGASSIFNFSLALLIGLLSGVYSSIIIAVPLWGMLKKRELRKSPHHKLVVYKRKRTNEEKVLV